MYVGCIHDRAARHIRAGVDGDATGPELLTGGGQDMADVCAGWKAICFSIEVRGAIGGEAIEDEMASENRGVVWRGI